MNVYVWVLLAALVVVAVTDWVAVARENTLTEQLAKPAFMLVLIAIAWVLHADGLGHGRWLLLGLVLSLAGDILLLRMSDLRFALGLGAFLLAHLAYLAMLVQMPHAAPLWPGVGAMAIVLVLVLVFWLGPYARRDPAAGGPPAAYAIVITVFAGYAWYTGHVVLALGATIFCVSDALIGYGRFVRERAGLQVAVMVTYHVAQVLIVVGALRPDVLGLR